MSGDKRARLKQWLESGEARLVPPTFPQRELWEASSIPLGDPSNHICCVINVRGAIVPDDCRMAVKRVVDRQEVLRLSLLPGKEGRLQMIRSSSEPAMRFRELSSAEARPEATEELAREIFREPFDMVQGPLYRTEVLSRSAEEHVIVLAIHHAIADGWSLGVFIQDLCGAYLQERMGRHEALPPVAVTYSQWGAAERLVWTTAELERRGAFWKKQLADRKQIWASSSEHRVELDRQVSEIPAPLTAAARDLARAHGVTLFSTLLTIFKITLARWTGETDIVVGTPVANRHKQAANETMGYFAGNVPLRTQIDPARPLNEALREAHERSLESFAEAMPFAELARALGAQTGTSAEPIFQVRFALQNHPIPDVSLPSLSAKLRMRSTGTARFDLGCEVTEDGDALEVVWLFRPHLHSTHEIAELDQQFQATLARACRTPENRITAIQN